MSVFLLGRNKTAALPFLHGVNYLSETFTPGDQPARPEASAYFLGTKKMNLVRYGIKWEMLQPTLGGALDSTYVSHIDTLIADVASYGGRLIIELHNYGRRTVSAIDYIIGETATVTSAHFANVWSRIATQWPQVHVVFGLMNEPHDQDTDILVAVSNAAIAAIRATGSAQTILVCANQWNSYGWVDDTYGNQTKMLNIVDSANNFMFDVHHYFDAFSAGQSTTVVSEATWKAGLDGFTTWARAHGKLGLCAEFGSPETDAGDTALTTFLAYLQTNNDVWRGWCHLGGGGWWTYAFFMRLDPWGSKFDGSNPFATPATTWTPDAYDMPPMTILEGDLPIVAPTNAVAKSRHFDLGSAAPWTYVAATVQMAALDGVFGPVSAAAVKETATTGQHGLEQAVSGLAANQVWVLSAIVKQGNFQQVELMLGKSDFSNYLAGVFNLNTGATTFTFTGGTGTGATQAITSLGAGYYLVALTGRVDTASTALTLRVFERDQSGDDTIVGSAGRVAFYIDHVQLENGSVASRAKITR